MFLYTWIFRVSVIILLDSFHTAWVMSGSAFICGPAQTNYGYLQWNLSHGLDAPWIGWASLLVQRWFGTLLSMHFTRRGSKPTLRASFLNPLSSDGTYVVHKIPIIACNLVIEVSSCWISAGKVCVGGRFYPRHMKIITLLTLVSLQYKRGRSIARARWKRPN